MSKLTILVDLDGICVNLPQAFVDTVNLEREGGDEVSVEDLTDYEFSRALPEGGSIYDYMGREGWWEALPLISGASDALYALDSLGAEVVICSSPGNYPRAAMEKMRWVYKHLPFLPQKNIIITRRKELCRGDVLIDDAPDQLLKYRKAWPEAKLLAIAWPYNHGADVDMMAQSWREPVQAWATIVEALEPLL